MAFTLPNSYTEYVPLDVLLASQLNNDNANNKYMANNFPQTVMVMSQFTADQTSWFFNGNGTFTKSFTVPVAGTWEIHTPFSVVCHRAAAAMNTLYVKIDGSTIVQYTYASESADSEWGMSRRTINDTVRAVSLTAGSHTLTTTGNLYYQSGYSTNPQFYITRLTV